MEVFNYQGFFVEITPGVHNRKPVYWVYINGYEVVSLNKLDTAKRIAVRFIDHIKDRPAANRFVSRPSIL